LVLDGRQTLRARGDLAAQGLQERPPHEDRQHTGQHDSGNVRASRRAAEEGGHGVLPGAAGKRAPAAAASASATSMVILTSKVTSLSGPAPSRDTDVTSTAAAGEPEPASASANSDT